MKRVLLFIMLALGTSGFWQVMAQTESKPCLYCILLDNTQSMIGRGGPDNIWGEVKQYCCDLVDETSETDVVWLYTFAAELQGPKKFTINSESDKSNVKNAINAIDAVGKHTYISKNLREALGGIDFSDYQLRFFLLTDGIEEGVDVFQDALNEFKMKNDRDVHYLFYVDLKDKAPESWRKKMDETTGVNHVVGLQEIASIKPVHDIVTYEFNEETKKDTTFEFVQQFMVVKGKLTENFSFDVSIPSKSSNGYNLDIEPSKVSINNMKKENGKYSVKFAVKKLSNNSLRECSIPVVLKGCQENNTILTVDPAGFTIEFKQEVIPPVEAPAISTEGWE